MIRRGSTVVPMKERELTGDELRDTWRHWTLTGDERIELRDAIRKLEATLKNVGELPLPRVRTRCALISSFEESFAKDRIFPGGSMFWPADILPEVIEAVDGRSTRLDLLFEFFARASGLIELRQPSLDPRRRTAVLKLLPERHPAVNFARRVGITLTEWPLSDQDPRAPLAREFAMNAPLLRFTPTNQERQERFGAAGVSAADHMVGSIADEITGEAWQEFIPELWRLGVGICRCFRIFVPASGEQEYCSERCKRRLKQRQRRANP
jgi:hypothetical protein